jgi:hypothetical protein
MFMKGQKVVCVNGKFPDLARQMYAQLPQQDSVYTIRAIFIGRGNLSAAGSGKSDGEIGVLLEELRNPRDPALKNGLDGELGFNSERFAPLQTESEPHEAVAEEEDEAVVVA